MPFNNSPQPSRPENFMNYSRGVQTDHRNDAFGKMFSSLAAFGEQVATGADTLVKEGIRDEIYNESDAILDEFGVGEATLAESSVENEPLPSQLASANENLSRLQSAFERGVLKESHYWARMNSVVRQLRQKYPGYRPEIDQMVAGVTGATPANALRDTLFQEWRAKSTSTDPFSKLVERVAGETGLPADWELRMNSENPYDYNSLLVYYSEKNKDKWERESRRAAMAEESDRGTLNNTTALRTFRMDANQLVNTSLKDLNGIIGQSYQQILTNIDKAQAAVASGTPQSQEDTEKLVGSVANLELIIKDQLNTLYSSPFGENSEHSYVEYVDHNTAQEIINTSMAPIALADGDFGLVKSLSAWIDAQKTDAGRELIRDVQIMPTIGAMREQMGDVGTSIAMQHVPDVLDSLSKTILVNEHGRSMTDPSANIVQSIDTGAAKGQGADYYNGLIDTWTNTINQLGSELPLSAIQNKAQYMFGPDANEIFQRLDDKSRFDYFRKVASPGVTQKMLEIKAMGDIQTWDTYQQWVTRGFMFLFQNKIQTIQNAGDSWFRPGMGVAWVDNTS